MAQSGGGGFGWFIIGIAVGAAGLYWGPTAFQKYVRKEPEQARVTVAPGNTPDMWRRMARFDIEFSQYREQGQNWDWPMTAPELQLCIQDGSEYRKCLGPPDSELRSCQGVFRCTTGPIRVPDGPFRVELNEWDDYNKPDPIGASECNIGQTCRLTLGVVTVRAAQ